MLTARKQFPVLQDGRIFNLPSDGEVMAYLKQDKTNTALILLNISNQKHHLEVRHQDLTGKFTNLFSGLSFEFNGASHFELMPGDYIVYVK